MSYIFFLSIFVTLCFIISVAVAANTPDSGTTRTQYETAYGLFFAGGLVGSLFLNFYLYPKRDMLIDSVTSKLKTK